MLQVVPAILEKSFNEMVEKVARVKPYTNFLQIDIMDNTFVPNETFRDAARIATLDATLEIHLMIDKPALYFQQWALPNVQRLIVHFETIGNMEHDIALMRTSGKEIGLAINPETLTYEIKDYLDMVDMVVVMGVDPGFSGQQFQKDVLEKVKEMKKWKPELLVEVDGGVNMYNRDMIEAAGATHIGAASALWKAEDLGTAWKALQGVE
ncbi:MAG: hypothetical protein HYV32_05435 [Candidatus Kerfeldbacteria bacterium]|nr:hypothetical protein [Candidatus Kerfeldbacteria bacterium]